MPKSEKEKTAETLRPVRDKMDAMLEVHYANMDKLAAIPGDPFQELKVNELLQSLRDFHMMLTSVVTDLERYNKRLQRGG